MKSIAFATLATLTALTAAPPVLAEPYIPAGGKLLYQPYAQDVNRYREELNTYERSGGLNFSGPDGYICPDPLKDVRIEGRVVAILIDKCLADKLMAKRYLNPDGSSYAAESVLSTLQYKWAKVNYPNVYWIELKLRCACGGSLGSIRNNGRFMPPTRDKTYVSTQY